MAALAPQIPVTAPFVVVRDRLTRLAIPVSRDPPQFVLVTAPAGSGKTTLLAQWAAGLLELGDLVAWISVTPTDGDRGHLPARVLKALADSAHARAPAAAGRLAALPIPPNPLDPGFVAEAALPLREVRSRVWLFLDDHHLLGTETPLAWLDRYAAAAGPNLRVVVASRRDLGRELSQHVLDGSVVQVTGGDLAFSVPETAQLLSGHGLQLHDSDVVGLHRRMEGWAAGLRLGAITLASSPEPRTTLASWAGSTRQIGDYLVAEVLRGLPPDTHDFLRCTSTPRVLTVELAAALSGRDDAGAVLERLLTDGLLITRRDAKHPTYRYHALLRNHLLEEEAASDLARYRQHRRTSAQDADDRGDQDEAIEQATAGQAWDLLVDLLARHGLSMILRGDEAAVGRALTAVPSRHRTHRLVLLGAELALRRGDLVEAQEQLEYLPHAVGYPADAETEVLRTAVLVHHGLMSGRPGPDFSDLLEFPAPLLHSPETILLTSMQAMALIEMDQGARATTELRRVHQFATAHGYHNLALDCLSHLIFISWGERGYPQTLALVEEAVAFAAERGWQATTPMAAIYLIGAGSGFAMHDLAVVERYLPQVAAVNATAEPKVGAFAALLTVYTRHAALASPATLTADLREAWDGIDEQVIRPAGMTSLCLIEFGLALEHQDLALAELVADRAERHLTGRGDLQVIRAGLLLHQGQPAQALAFLDELDTPGLRTTARGCVLAAMLRVLAASALHKDDEARDALVEAVRIAAELDLLEPLAVAPPAFLELMRRSRVSLDAQAGFVFRALAAASARKGFEDHDRSRPAGAQLTKREDVVLRALASLATLQEIADHQRVSENTVKTHVKAIYDKLGVHNRRDAVRVGRERGMNL